MSNAMNQNMRRIWMDVEKARHRNSLYVTQDNIEDEISEIVNDLADLQEDVVEERQGWGFWGSALGCVGGAVLGVGGGPMGMIAGCTLGSKLGGKAADWMYDGSTLDTSLEKQLQAKEAELDSLEYEIDKTYYTYPELGARNAQKAINNALENYQEGFDEFEKDFYSLTGKDYLTGMIGDVAQFAATQWASAQISDWWTAHQSQQAADAASTATEMLNTEVLASPAGGDLMGLDMPTGDIMDYNTSFSIPTPTEVAESVSVLEDPVSDWMGGDLQGLDMPVYDNYDIQGLDPGFFEEQIPFGIPLEYRKIYGD
tara:strand:- start:293 stop:1231 length:939 start_codon:yes stop_codon:yes gene_type:complete